MKRIFVSLSLALPLCLACDDPSGPAIAGRWAAQDIELTINADRRELRYVCGQAATIPMYVRISTKGDIAFSGRLRNPAQSLPFTFSGRVTGDTLNATLRLNWYGQISSHTYVMTADGEPNFGPVVCAVAF